MTDSIMLINETDDECRIAVVENGLLQEMLIEHSLSGQTKNNIYKGVVVQIQSSLQAAFVDFGTKKHGFLPNSELNPFLYSGKKHSKSEPIQKKIKVGQELVVQVTRESTATKGAALTTNITLPGRFMVLMPNSDKGGVSKRIDNAGERERLKSFLSGIESEEHSVIIRTAGLGRSLTELKKDYTMLKKTWNDIWSGFEKMDGPGLILEEPDFVTKTLRDYYTDDIKEVWVDNPETYQKALSFFKEVSPRNQKNLKLFVDDRSLFATYHIERQVEQLTSKQVKLRSGGSIVIDQTEALVAIDVNSGRSNQEGNIDSTALRTNLEAAEEVARQLRLRNLGGLIVIDFIDMENESYRKKVEDKLSESMEKDKAQLRFNPISQFGLLELSRQRLSVGISSTVETTCPVCEGKGKIPSLQASTNLIIRSIRELAAKGNVKSIEGDLPLDLVNNLLNERRQSIYDLEMEFDIDIILRGRPDILVFNDRCLKVIHEKRDRQRQQQSKKEPQKQETGKKRPTKHGQKKDGSHPKKQQKENIQEPKPTPSDPETSDAADEVKEEKPVEASAPPQAAPVSDAEVTVNGNGIHPSCLFTDVKELEEDELEKVTSAFERRLKGRTDDAQPQLINNKYLWKSQNGKQETEIQEASLAEADTESEPQAQDLKNDSDQAAETDDTAKGEEKNEKAAASSKKRSTRRGSSRKSSKKKEETAESEPSEETPADKVSTEKEPDESESKAPARSGKKTSSTRKKSSSSSAKKKAGEPEKEAEQKSETKKSTGKKSTSKTSKSKSSEADKTSAKSETKSTAKKSTGKKQEPAESTDGDVSAEKPARKTSKRGSGKASASKTKTGTSKTSSTGREKKTSDKSSRGKKTGSKKASEKEEDKA